MAHFCLNKSALVSAANAGAAASPSTSALHATVFTGFIIDLSFGCECPAFSCDTGTRKLSGQRDDVRLLPEVVDLRASARMHPGVALSRGFILFSTRREVQGPITPTPAALSIVRGHGGGGNGASKPPRVSGDIPASGYVDSPGPV